VGMSSATKPALMALCCPLAVTCSVLDRQAAKERRNEALFDRELVLARCWWAVRSGAGSHSGGRAPPIVAPGAARPLLA
jgi:hypothetical protein